MQTDEQLAELIRTGDERAFRELMNRHIDAIYGFSLHYTRNESDAEDVTQDTFFKVWKFIRRYKAGKQFRPWLYAIARNTALDHLKKRRSIVFSDLDNEEDGVYFAENIPDAEPLPHAVFEHAETAAHLAGVLDILHPDHKSVLMLHYHEDMTFEEIAVVMDKPMNTVKSWHRRALEKIRPELDRRLHGRPDNPDQPHQKSA